jgi:hypothetical protein
MLADKPSTMPLERLYSPAIEFCLARPSSPRLSTAPGDPPVTNLVFYKLDFCFLSWLGSRQP